LERPAPASLGTKEKTGTGQVVFSGLDPDTSYTASVFGETASVETFPVALDTEATAQADPEEGFVYNISVEGQAERWRFLLSANPESELTGSEVETIEAWRTSGLEFTDTARRAAVVLETEYPSGTRARRRVAFDFELPEARATRVVPIELGTSYRPPPGRLSFRSSWRAGTGERLTEGRVWPAGTLRVEHIEAGFPRGVGRDYAGADLIGPNGENYGEEVELDNATLIRVRLWAKAKDGKSPSVYEASLKHEATS
jgi:hypothetical protein